MILGKKERKDMIMNKTEQLIQAETTLHLIDKLVKKIHKEYPTALITEFSMQIL
jgi:glycyl-tRNA synthetase beta subunit